MIGGKLVAGVPKVTLATILFVPLFSVKFTTP